MYLNSLKLLHVFTLVAPSVAIIRELHDKCYSRAEETKGGYLTFIDPPPGIPTYNFNNCYVRFQNPNDRSRGGSNNPDASCVTRSKWEATPEGVAGTINNFDNRGNGNNQLWLDACPFALQYADLIRRTDPAFRGIIPQPDLNTYNTVVSLILPSGVRKLEIVNADTGILSRENERKSIGIHGIRGTLEPGDYAYSTVGDFYAALNDMWVKNEPKEWFLDAIDGDLNCVKIDLGDVRRDRPWQRP
ncbi:MAG: hypothetical protein Q9182_006028 [Xanthomendoza sp. 2 TL-2023]